MTDFDDADDMTLLVYYPTQCVDALRFKELKSSKLGLHLCIMEQDKGTQCFLGQMLTAFSLTARAFNQSINQSIFICPNGKHSMTVVYVVVDRTVRPKH